MNRRTLPGGSSSGVGVPSLSTSSSLRAEPFSTGMKSPSTYSSKPSASGLRSYNSYTGTQWSPPAPLNPTTQITHTLSSRLPSYPSNRGISSTGLSKYSNSTSGLSRSLSAVYPDRKERNLISSVPQSYLQTTNYVKDNPAGQSSQRDSVQKSPKSTDPAVSKSTPGELRPQQGEQPRRVLSRHRSVIVESTRSSNTSSLYLHSRDHEDEENQSIFKYQRLKLSKNGLHLSNMSLSVVPEQVLKMTSLEELDLSRNKLTSIPTSFQLLTHVQFLDLSDNSFAKIPHVVIEMSCLVSLNMSSNHLTSIPAEISQLENLQEFIASKNHISEIPYFVPFSPKLKLLDLTKNAISMIPPSIQRLSELYEFSLSANQISVIPETIGCISTLVFLDISQNMISCLPESISNLNNLAYLGLEQNRLFSLSNSMCHMSSLSVLGVQGNPIEYPTQEILQKDTKEIVQYLSRQMTLIETPDGSDTNVLQEKIADQDRTIRRLTLTSDASSSISMSKIESLESLLRHESNRNVLLNDQLHEAQEKLSVYETALGSKFDIAQVRDFGERIKGLEADVESLAVERDRLSSQLIDKERQFIEGSQRKKELLSESIKKIEELVRRVKELEEENKKLSSERRALSRASSPNISGKRMYDSIYQDMQAIKAMTAGAALEMSKQSTQLVRLAFRIDFNEDAGRQAVKIIEPPNGEVTMACVEVYTKLDWNHAPEAMAVANATINSILREKAQAHNGYEVFTVGYANFMTFSSSLDAVIWACECKAAVSRVEWRSKLGDLSANSLGDMHLPMEEPLFQLRMGIHKGNPQLFHNAIANRVDYIGRDVNVVFGIASMCGPNQIVATKSSVANIASDLPKKNIRIIDSISAPFDGFETPCQLIHVLDENDDPMLLTPLTLDRGYPSAIQTVLDELNSIREQHTYLSSTYEQIENDVLKVFDALFSDMIKSMKESGQLQDGVVSKQADLASRMIKIQKDLTSFSLNLKQLQNTAFNKVVADCEISAQKIDRLQDFLEKILKERPKGREQPVSQLRPPSPSISTDYPPASSPDSELFKGSKDQASRYMFQDMKEINSKISLLAKRAKTSRIKTLDEATTTLRYFAEQLASSEILSKESLDRFNQEREKPKTIATSPPTNPTGLRRISRVSPISQIPSPSTPVRTATKTSPVIKSTK